MSLFVDIEKRLGNFQLTARFETRGGTLGLLGASGCGKSMTLKCIAGIERPDRGVIVLDGETLFDSARGIDLPPQRRRIGYLFQNFALFPNMTVEQNILCGLRWEKDRLRRNAELERAVRLCRLEGLEKLRPRQLAGGQQQRTALARILASAPRLLLLDEPAAGMNSKEKVDLSETILRIKDRGFTVLLVEHDMKLVMNISDYIYVLNYGTKIAEGIPSEIQTNPDVIAAYLGGE